MFNGIIPAVVAAPRPALAVPYTSAPVSPKTCFGPPKAFMPSSKTPRPTIPAIDPFPGLTLDAALIPPFIPLVALFKSEGLAEIDAGAAAAGVVTPPIPAFIRFKKEGLAGAVAAGLAPNELLPNLLIPLSATVNEAADAPIDVPIAPKSAKAACS